MNELLPTSESEGLNRTRSSLIGRLYDWDDSKTWTEFFETYWRFIYRCAMKGGLSAREAEEVVQSTMVTVAGKIGAGEFQYNRKRAAFKTWLWRIVWFHILRQRRQQQQRSRRFAEIRAAGANGDADTGFADIADARNPHEEQWDQEWRQNLLNAAADRVKLRVDSKQFQIFAYHVIEGHSVRETVQALRTTGARVYLVKHRVTKMMRREFNRLCENPPIVDCGAPS